MNKLFTTDTDLDLPNGIYLFLGYSSKDEDLLKKVTRKGVMGTIGAIQGLVSYHNINGNKVCTVLWIQCKCVFNATTKF